MALRGTLNLQLPPHPAAGRLSHQQWVPARVLLLCHIFFIHSSVDGHLGRFHVLAIVNRAAMNIVVHDSF